MKDWLIDWLIAKKKGFWLRHMVQFSFIPSTCVMRYSGMRHSPPQCYSSSPTTWPKDGGSVDQKRVTVWKFDFPLDDTLLFSRKTFLFPSPVSHSQVHAGAEIPRAISPYDFQYIVYYKIHVQTYKHVNIYFNCKNILFINKLICYW